MQPWRVHKTRRLLERPWLTLHEQHVVLPGGAEIEQFHLIEAPDWVAVLALSEMDCAEAKRELKYAAPALERMARRPLPSEVVRARRHVLATRVLNGR